MVNDMISFKVGGIVIQMPFSKIICSSSDEFLWLIHQNGDTYTIKIPITDTLEIRKNCCDVVSVHKLKEMISSRDEKIKADLEKTKEQKAKAAKQMRENKKNGLYSNSNKSFQGLRD